MCFPQFKNPLLSTVDVLSHSFPEIVYNFIPYILCILWLSVLFKISIFSQFIICVKHKFSTDFLKNILFIKNIHSFNKSINCKLFRHILQSYMHNYSCTVSRLPSSSRSFLFISIPSPYPPIDPSAAITLWQGITITIGFLLFAPPTARKPFGHPAASATSL